jgi:hypothetical protein
MSPILLSQDIATTLVGTAGAGIVAIMRDLISVIEAEFLPCRDIASGHNPEGAIRFFHGAVRITGMVDIAGRIVKRLAIDSKAVIQMKDVGIACGAAAHALIGRNFFSNIRTNPGSLGDILRRKESLASNARWTHIELYLHSLMPHNAGFKYLPYERGSGME